MEKCSPFSVEHNEKNSYPLQKATFKISYMRKEKQIQKEKPKFLSFVMALLAAESENCRTTRRFSIGPVPDNISFVSVIKLLTENFVNRRFRPVIVLVMIHSHFLSFEPYRPSI